MKHRDLSPEEARDIVVDAAVRNTPAALTCEREESWRNYPSRFLGVRGSELWLEYPPAQAGLDTPDLRVGQLLGVAFKQRHYKYIACSSIADIGMFEPDEGEKVYGVRIDWPERMQRLQRRAFNRAIVPADRPAFVSLWEGGVANEPPEPLRANLVYTGQLVDFSAGGFRVRLLDARDGGFQVGDLFGAILTFAGASQHLRVDAEFRHAQTDEFGLTMGMQFAGLTQTARGREVLQHIIRIAAEYHRLEMVRKRTAPADAETDFED